MKVDRICDFCNKPITDFLRRVQLNYWNDKKYKCLFITGIEADLCQSCALELEKEIRRKIKRLESSKHG